MGYEVGAGRVSGTLQALLDGGIFVGDVRDTLKCLSSDSIHCVVTSPPYWGLRDYNCDGQIGHEAVLDDYIIELVRMFRSVRRVLRDDGTLWLNMGDSYATTHSGKQGLSSQRRGRWFTAENTLNRVGDGIKAKDLIGLPWRLALALQDDGWWLRADIIWSKPNPVPSPAKDRPTIAHEYIFLLSKSARYLYRDKAISEQAVTGHRRRNVIPKAWDTGPGSHRGKQGHYAKGRAPRVRNPQPFGSDGTRNARSVWTFPTQPSKFRHHATFPEELARRCILAGSHTGEIVLDPFFGSGTVGVVAERLGRRWIGCELNEGYVEIARKRIAEARRTPGRGGVT